MRRRSPRLARVLAVACLALVTPSLREARADTIFGRTSARTDYVPFDELSYEVILTPGAGYAAEMRLRVALLNTSSQPQDVVLNLALPRSATLRGLAVARDGKWSPGAVIGAEPATAAPPPGTVFAREMEAASANDLPAVEVFGFGLEPGTTTQLELELEVYPTLRADRWEIELPRRNSRSANLSEQRRVIVRGLPRGETFAVENEHSQAARALESIANDAVSVSWPAHVRGGPALDGRFEVTPDATGRGGDFRLFMRLGQSRAAQPDHLVLVVDRSSSTSDRLDADASKLFAALLDSAPRGTTFDAVTFHRHASAVMDATAADARHAGARAQLREGVAAAARQPGSDLRGALKLVGERLAETDAKHPLVVIVTDGMLPMTVDPRSIAEALTTPLPARVSPELLFVIDDAILARHGLDAGHPVATLAAGLGARISLSTLSNLSHEDLDDLLAAPRVLGGLAIDLPARATLLDDLPEGLVAGNFVMLSGRYDGRAPAAVTVRGRFGARNYATRLRPIRRVQAPPALVAFVEEDELAHAAVGSLSTPEWYSRGMRREASENLVQAGSTGFEQVGQLDAAIFERSLRFRVLPRVRACYNQALTRNQVQGGRIVLGMEVGKGEVMRASLESRELERADPTFEACLEEAAWAIDVPAGKLDTQTYMIRYPITLTPPAGGRPPATEAGDDPVFRMLIERADALAR